MPYEIFMNNFFTPIFPLFTYTGSLCGLMVSTSLFLFLYLFGFFHCLWPIGFTTVLNETTWRLPNPRTHHQVNAENLWFG